MEADLNSLEDKVVKLINLCNGLRDENIQLRQEVTRLHQDTQILKQNMSLASLQLEQLLQTLPEEET
jgi:cell division protein ZapB